MIPKDMCNVSDAIPKVNMPLLAINLPDKLFDQIKQLVLDGRYATPEAFLEVAAFSQLALERGATPDAIVARGHRQAREASIAEVAEEAFPTRAAPRSHKPNAIRLPKQVFVMEQPSQALSIAAVIGPFRMPGGDRDCPPPSKLHPCPDHVFGQVNRLFPMKLVCRWILRAVCSRTPPHAWPLYSEILDALGDSAAQLGSLFESWDAASNRKRDDQWATGLPRRGNSASRDRFLSQFIARITRSSDLNPGAIYQYQLANFADGRIALTPSGIKFAELHNAVLDGEVREGINTLGDAEVQFLSEQIQAWAPAEHGDMRTVLRALALGKSAPSELLNGVREHFPAEWSEPVISTHVGGVIARLADLQMIKRWWHGRNVEYRLGNATRIEQFMTEIHKER